MTAPPDHPVVAKLESMAATLAAHARPVDMRRVARNDARLAELGATLLQFGDRRRTGRIYLACAAACGWFTWLWRGPLPLQVMLTPMPRCPACGAATALHVGLDPAPPAP